MVDESYFEAKRVCGKRGCGSGGKIKAFVIKKLGDKVYTQIMSNGSASELVPIIKRLAPDGSAIYSDKQEIYDGLVNASYKKQDKHSTFVFFYSFTRKRMVFADIKHIRSGY